MKLSKKRIGLLALSLALLALTIALPLRFLTVASAVPDSSVQILKTGCPNAQNCSFGNYPTESSFALPYTQQKVFQNPRSTSLQDYYVFYSQNMSLPGSGCTSPAGTTNLCYECAYAYSPNGVSWRVNQTIGSGPAGLGNYYINCSATYYDDTANNQLLVYLVAARNAGTTGTNHNIEFTIGNVSDAANAISWGPAEIVSSSSPTQNFQFPVLQVDPNGYLQLVYSWVDSSANRQTVDLCSSQTPHPTANPAWTCNGGLNNSLFTAQTAMGQKATSFMPQLQPLPGHSVLVLQGPCSNTATSGCAPALSVTEDATIVDWNGVTQSFKPAASFTYPASAPSDRRSSTVDTSTGTFYLAYNNGTDSYWTRSLASPYAAWSNPTHITSNNGEGRILSLSGSGNTHELVFISATDQPNTVSGGGGTGSCGPCPSVNMYTNTPSSGTSWSTATTLYSNTTWAATWANAPWTVNTSTNSRLPLVWEQHVCGHATNVPCTSQPEEMWFDSHILFNPTSQLKASISHAPTNPATGQTVTFTAIVSGGTSPYTYNWNFGDGTTGTGPSRSHTYSNTGSFMIALTVTDSGSPTQTATAQQSIRITNSSQTPPLMASFTFSPASPDMGQSVSFSAAASGGISPYTFSWNFGDGTTITGSSASHTFTKAGSFLVTLTVKDSAANTEAASRTVTVNPQLSGSFTYSPPSPLPLLPVSFTASASGGAQPYTYAWDFGDGSSGTGDSTSHSYLLPGSYSVTLTITDSNAQTFTTTQTIIVLTNLL